MHGDLCPKLKTRPTRRMLVFILGLPYRPELEIRDRFPGAELDPALRRSIGEKENCKVTTPLQPWQIMTSSRCQ